MLPQMDEFILDKRFRGFEFLERCDHRKHDAHFASRAGPQQAAQLRTQKGWPVETDADGAPSKRRVFLLDLRHVRQNLVGADIEGAESNLLAINKFEGGPVKSLLFAHPWQSRRQHELDFGPEKPDRHSPSLRDVLEIDQHSGVHMQIDRDAVLGHGRHVAQFVILLLLARAQPCLFGIGKFDVGRRAQMNIAGDAINDHGIAGLNQIDNIGTSPTAAMPSARATIATWLKAPDSSRTRPRIFGAIVFEQRSRPHGAGDDHRIIRQILVSRSQNPDRELMQQAVGEFVEIMQPFAQKRLGPPL